MQIAGTPPIDWGGHARHAERRTQRDAGNGAVRDHTGSPSAAAVAQEPPVAEESATRPEKATAQQQIDKMQPRIERFIERLGQRLGMDTTEFTNLITDLQRQYVGEGVTTAEPGAHGSYRAAVAHLVHTWRQGGAEDVAPTDGEEPAGEVEPVAGDVDPVTGESVVVDLPDVTVPVVPPEATDPVELLDVMLTGVPADEA
jgi:hypothetical protein